MTVASELKEIAFLTLVILMGSYLLVSFAATPFAQNEPVKLVSCSPVQQKVDYYTRSIVKLTYSDGSVKQVRDYCPRPGTMQKYYCDPKGVLFELRYDCGGTCAGGRCVNVCSDSDRGLNTDVRGTTTVNEKYFTDTCVDVNTIKEFGCSASQELVTEVKTCSDGKKCNTGRCQ